MQQKTVSALFRIEGGPADEGVLDIYDAANTIYGLARALNIVSHAFANDDEIRKRADNAHGAHTYIHSSIKGCFEEKVDIRFEAGRAAKLGPSVLVSNFWDYLLLSWSSAVGVEYQPTTAHVRRSLRKNEDFTYEIADALETPMLHMQKSIARDNDVKIMLNRPKVGDVLTFDTSSLAFVTVRDEKTHKSWISGNVTKFNVLSDFGRLYSDEDERVLSFRLAHPDDQKMRSLAVNSMQEVVQGLPGKLRFEVSPVVSAQGIVKRYIVHSIR